MNHRHHERYNSRILLDADGRLQGGSVKLDFDVAQEPEAANAQLQLSKQDVFGDDIFLVWWWLGKSWSILFLFLLGRGFIYLFVFLFLLIFLVAFRCLGFIS